MRIRYGIRNKVLGMDGMDKTEKFARDIGQIYISKSMQLRIKGQSTIQIPF